MRKVIVSMNVTLDGFMSGATGELDWHFNYWNEEMADHAGRQLSKSDTILLGRVTYQAMAQYWPYQAVNMSFPRENVVFAEMMNNYHKIVFSRTLKEATWHNSRVVNTNLRTEILRLKQQPGRDMIVYGSGSIVSRLLQLGLVDEYELLVHPVVLSKGKALFKGLQSGRALELFDTKTFSSGVIVLYYRPY